MGLRWGPFGLWLLMCFINGLLWGIFLGTWGLLPAIPISLALGGILSPFFKERR